MASKFNNNLRLSKRENDRMKNSSTPCFANLLVGRDKELAAMNSHLRGASNGSGRLVLLTGETGTGKTTLMRHFCLQRQRMNDATVVSVDFANFNNYEPYAPFLQLAKILSKEKADGEYQTISQKMATDGKTGSVGNNDEIELRSLYALQSRQGLIQQKLIAKIIKASQTKVLVISFYNAHLASLTAWKFIHYLTEAIQDHRILLVTTLRGFSSKPAKKHPDYSDVLQRMNREKLVYQIEMTTLDRKQANILMLKVFKQKDFSQQLIDTLLDITGGLPGKILSSLEKMVQASILFQENGVWFEQEDVTRNSLFELLSDESEVSEIRERVEKLPPDQMTIMRYLALMNVPVTHKLLAVITDRSRLDIIRDLMALTGLSLLRQCNNENYEINHAAITTVVLEGLSRREKVAMHEIIAAGIEVDSGINFKDRIYHLAYHFSCTKKSYLAFKYLYKAGVHAAQSFAFIEAQDFFSKAFNLRSKVRAELEKQLIDLLQWMAWLNRVLGNWQESIKRYSEAFELCTDGQSRLRNQIRVQLGLTHFHANNWRKAQDYLQASINERQDLSQFDQAIATFGMANVSFELGEFDQASTYCKQSLRLADPLEADKLKANIFNTMGAIENIRGQRLKAITLYSKSVPIFKNIGDQLGLARVYHNIGMTHADDGQWQTANEFYGQSLTLSDSMGLSPLKSIAFLNRALALTHLHRFEEAREYNFKAYRLCKRLKDELGAAEYHKIQGIIEGNQNSWSEARDHLRKALRKFDALENKLGRAECEQVLGELACNLHKTNEAFTWFGRALTSYKVLGLERKTSYVENRLQKLDPQKNKVNKPVDKCELV